MPFDAMTPASDAATELFMDRRRRAAELWRGVPHQVFNMGRCERGADKGCALAWLAAERHEGWHWNGHYPIGPNNFSMYEGAAAYFGITVAYATACLAGTRATANFHGRWYISRVTRADVADALLRLPVVGAP